MPLTPVAPQCLQWRWMQAETRMQTENWWAGRSHPWKRGECVLGKLLPLFKALGINKIRECATWRSWKVSCADVSYSRLDGENSSSDSQSLTLQIWMRCCLHKRNRKYRAAGLTRKGTGYRESFEVNGESCFTHRVWKFALKTLLHIQRVHIRACLPPFKGIAHTEIKILLIFTHPHVMR